MSLKQVLVGIRKSIRTTHSFSKTPTEMHIKERCVSIKNLNAQTFRNFELVKKNGNTMPFWKRIGFQQMNRLDLQERSNDTFLEPPVFVAQCIIDKEKKLDFELNCDFMNNNLFQAYGETVS